MKLSVLFPFGLFPLADENFSKMCMILQGCKDSLKTYTDLGCTDLFL